jgi:hypothetical protein
MGIRSLAKFMQSASTLVSLRGVGASMGTGRLVVVLDAYGLLERVFYNNLDWAHGGQYAEGVPALASQNGYLIWFLSLTAFLFALRLVSALTTAVAARVESFVDAFTGCNVELRCVFDGLADPSRNELLRKRYAKRCHQSRFAVRTCLRSHASWLPWLPSPLTRAIACWSGIFSAVGPSRLHLSPRPALAPPLRAHCVAVV